MKNKWNVMIDGKEHEIKFKSGAFRGKKIVDGVSTPVKSKSMFIRVFDEPIELEGKTLHLTSIGSKVDLAVDDVYLNYHCCYYHKRLGSKRPVRDIGWHHGRCVCY